MSKYKVGDKVRILENTTFGANKGDIAIVTNANAPSICSDTIGIRVRLPNREDVWLLNESVEFVESKEEYCTTGLFDKLESYSEVGKMLTKIGDMYQFEGGFEVRDGTILFNLCLDNGGLQRLDNRPLFSKEIMDKMVEEDKKRNKKTTEEDEFWDEDEKEEVLPIIEEMTKYPGRFESLKDTEEWEMTDKLFDGDKLELVNDNWNYLGNNGKLWLVKIVNKEGKSYNEIVRRMVK